MKKFYISFGQIHTHRINNYTLDKDCLLEVTALNMADARDRAFKLFDGKFCMIYDVERFNPKEIDEFFPRGVIKL